MLCVGAKASRDDNCRDPPDLHRLLFVFDTENLPVYQPGRRDAFALNAATNPDCQRHLTMEQRGSMQLEQRSSCPWEGVPDVDVYRFPKELIFARCLCEKCRGRNGSTEFACERVFKPTVVLRRKVGVCENGLRVYEPWIQSVPVGCTCASKETTVARKRRSASILDALL